MEQEIPPLETLSTWYLSQPTEVRSHIALMSRTLLGLPLSTSTTALNVSSTYLAWLTARLAHIEHVGRALVACCLIDFEMEEFGKPETWEELLNAQLDLVERIPAGGFRILINRQLGEHAQRREGWLAAAHNWWNLRSAELHSDTIRAWMMTKNSRSPHSD